MGHSPYIRYIVYIQIFCIQTRDLNLRYPSALQARALRAGIVQIHVLYMRDLFFNKTKRGRPKPPHYNWITRGCQYSATPILSAINFLGNIPSPFGDEFRLPRKPSASEDFGDGPHSSARAEDACWTHATLNTWDRSASRMIWFTGVYSSTELLLDAETDADAIADLRQFHDFDHTRQEKGLDDINIASVDRRFWLNTSSQRIQTSKRYLLLYIQATQVPLRGRSNEKAEPWCPRSFATQTDPSI